MLDRKYPLVLGLAGMLGLGATSQSVAAPVLGCASIKAAAAGDTINVQWRGGWGWRGGGWGWRGGWGWGPGFGIGLGLGLAGAALAAPYYGGYGCGYDYCGGPGYAVAPAYAYAPGYPGYNVYYAYAPAPGVWGGVLLSTGATGKVRKHGRVGTIRMQQTNRPAATNVRRAASAAPR